MLASSGAPFFRSRFLALVIDELKGEVETLEGKNQRLSKDIIINSSGQLSCLSCEVLESILYIRKVMRSLLCMNPNILNGGYRSTVNNIFSTGNGSRPVGGKERNQLAHLFRVTRASQRNSAQCVHDGLKRTLYAAGYPGDILHHGIGSCRLNKSRRYAVHPDAPRSKFFGKAFAVIVRFDLYQGNHGDIDEYLDNGTSDMLITSKETTLDSDEWIVIRKLPIFIVVSVNHPLATRSSLSLFELSGEPFVGLKKNCGLKATLPSRFKNTDFELASTYDAEDLITVAGFIKAGLEVSILPQTMGLLLESLVWIPIQEEGWEWGIGVKWRKDRYLSPVAKQLIDYIEHHQPQMEELFSTSFRGMSGS